jgi:hypothetical protein
MFQRWPVPGLREKQGRAGSYNPTQGFLPVLLLSSGACYGKRQTTGRYAGAFKFKPDFKTQMMVSSEAPGSDGGEPEPAEWEGKMNSSYNVVLWLLESQQRLVTNKSIPAGLAYVCLNNTSHLGQKGRFPTERLPPPSVYLLRLFPGLARLQEDLDQ